MNLGGNIKPSARAWVGDRGRRRAGLRSGGRFCFAGPPEAECLDDGECPAGIVPGQFGSRLFKFAARERAPPPTCAGFGICRPLAGFVAGRISRRPGGGSGVVHFFRKTGLRNHPPSADGSLQEAASDAGRPRAADPPVLYESAHPPRLAAASRRAAGQLNAGPIVIFQARRQNYQAVTSPRPEEPGRAPVFVPLASGRSLPFRRSWAGAPSALCRRSSQMCNLPTRSPEVHIQLGPPNRTKELTQSAHGGGAVTATVRWRIHSGFAGPKAVHSSRWGPARPPWTGVQ